MAWLEVELSLGVRRMLAVMLAVWSWMMGFAGFGLLVVGLVVHSHVPSLDVPRSSPVISSSSSSSVAWFSYSLVVLGTLMTVVYALASLVSLSIVGFRSLFNERDRWRRVMTVQLVLLLLMPQLLTFVGVFSFLQKSAVTSALDEMLNRAMFHYKNDIKWKTKVDEMQLSYRCCGVKNYKDWFRYSWVEKTNVAKEGEMTGSVKEDGEFYTDSVPFSCCDVDSPAPCIHDNVLEASGRYGYNPARELTVYTDGCSAVVSDTLQTTLIGCVLVGLSLVALTLVLIYRYVQSSMDTSLYHNDVEFSSPGFMLEGDDLPKPPPPPPTAEEQEKVPKVITKVIEIDETTPVAPATYPPHWPVVPAARQMPRDQAGDGVDEDENEEEEEEEEEEESKEPTGGETVERRQLVRTDKRGPAGKVFEDNMMDYVREKPEKDEDEQDDDRKRKKKKKKKRRKKKKKKKKPKRTKQRSKQRQKRKRRRKRQKKRKQQRTKRRRSQRRKQRRGRQKKRRKLRRKKRTRSRGRKRKHIRKAMKAARKVMRKAAKQAKKVARKAAKQAVKLAKTAVKAAMKPKF